MLLQRGRRSAAVLRASLVAGIIFSLTACADKYNPIEWGKSAVREVGSIFEGPPESAEPPPAEGRPYPNLATVPKPIRETPQARAERQAELERLTRERDKALADDQALRATGTLPPPAPAAPEPSPELRATPVTPPAARATPSPPPVAPAAPPPAPLAAAPVVPSAPAPQSAAPAVAAPVTAQRVGAVGFARTANGLSPAAQRTLAEAAAQAARTGNGRVRLVAAQVSRDGMTLEATRARSTAILQALAGGGLPAARVAIDEAMGRRVDLYDVYVER